MVTHFRRYALARRYALGALCIGLAVGGVAFAGGPALAADKTKAPAAKTKAPDLSGVFVRGLYMRIPINGRQDVKIPLPPDGYIPGMFGPGPITQVHGSTDPKKMFAEGDTLAPILRPAAAAAVRAHNTDVDAGTLVVIDPPACVPRGLFMELTSPGAIKIVQTATEVTLTFAADGQTRHIRLNATHPADVVPSLTGDSIGHWDGDALIVDTVGIDPKSPLDRFGTPHSAALHVVERLRLFDNRQSLEIHVQADDAANFIASWWGVVTYPRSTDSWIDPACH